MSDDIFIAFSVTGLLRGMRSFPVGWEATVLTPMGSVVFAKKTESSFAVNITRKPTQEAKSFIELMGSKKDTNKQKNTTMHGLGGRLNVQKNNQPMSKTLEELAREIQKFFEDNGFTNNT